MKLFASIAAALIGALALSACNPPSPAAVQTGATIACALVQAGIVTAQSNAALLNKAQAAANLTTANTLIASDCTAALVALQAAYTIAGVAAPATISAATAAQ